MGCAVGIGHGLCWRATVVDTDHVLVPAHQTWDGQDCLEVYIDPGNRNVEHFDTGDSSTPSNTSFPSTGVDSGEWICIALEQLAEDQTAVRRLKFPSTET